MENYRKTCKSGTKRKILMKFEGRKTVKFPGKRDFHPKKGEVNWWEVIINCISRNTRKQKLRKEIENEIMESTY